MLLVLSDKHKKDLSFLKRIDTETLQSFCELAVQFLRDGFDKNKFVSATKQFQVSAEPLKRAIEALGFLFIESARKNLSELDFVDSLLLLAYDDNVNKLLSEFYLDNLKRLRVILGELSFDVPHYVDLHWRLDVLLASRALRNQVKPVFLLQLDTKDGDRVTSQFLEADPTDLRHITSELEVALAEMKAANVRRVLRNVK